LVVKQTLTKLIGYPEKPTKKQAADFDGDEVNLIFSKEFPKTTEMVSKESNHHIPNVKLPKTFTSKKQLGNFHLFVRNRFPMVEKWMTVAIVFYSLTVEQRQRFVNKLAHQHVFQAVYGDSWPQQLDMYDLALMSNDQLGKKHTIALEASPEELKYRVIEDNEVKNGVIPWKDLPEDFPREVEKILANKHTLLLTLLAHIDQKIMETIVVCELQYGIKCGEDGPKTTIPTELIIERLKDYEQALREYNKTLSAPYGKGLKKKMQKIANDVTYENIEKILYPIYHHETPNIVGNSQKRLISLFFEESGQTPLSSSKKAADTFLNDLARELFRTDQMPLGRR
jgi:hypothetical protein